VKSRGPFWAGHADHGPSSASSRRCMASANRVHASPRRSGGLARARRERANLLSSWSLAIHAAEADRPSFGGAEIAKSPLTPVSGSKRMAEPERCSANSDGRFDRDLRRDGRRRGRAPRTKPPVTSRSALRPSRAAGRIFLERPQVRQCLRALPSRSGAIRASRANPARRRDPPLTRRSACPRHATLGPRACFARCE